VTDSVLKGRMSAAADVEQTPFELRELGFDGA
jgi:hypothetical protein